ncbi:hypothetical protein A6R68_23842, partial [Neotoma lepida]
SPRRLWWYHWICWLLSVVGIFCILLAHDHYTVDVVVAYYITTRLFWWYHTMANQQVLKEASQMNLLARNFSGYYIGVGRADCTGQVSDINLMGYGKSGQNARGLLTRLYSRAFILADPDGSNRMAFVSVELCMISQRLRLEVAIWFAIHPVSMNNSNHFVNSDNMGYAAYLFEQEKNRGYLPGQGPFVAGFASSNLGDVSPNILGPHCTNTGESCDNEKSTCPIGGPSMCMASGPGQDIIDSTQIIGRVIYQRAKVKTCKPALGYSFAAGTIDGVSGLNITQDIVDVQIVTLGSLAIAAIPGEFTTMSGRRFREAVKKEFESYGMKDMTVVISGLCNVYTHYITTYEEYQGEVVEVIFVGANPKNSAEN